MSYSKYNTYAANGYRQDSIRSLKGGRPEWMVANSGRAAAVCGFPLFRRGAFDLRRRL